MASVDLFQHLFSSGRTTAILQCRSIDCDVLPTLSQRLDLQIDLVKPHCLVVIPQACISSSVCSCLEE